MHVSTVIVAQSDCIVAEHLAANLHAHFKNIVVARDLEELHHHIGRDGADMVVLDLELVEVEEFRELASRYGEVALVCTHHAPDEEMWRLCLEMGALDCCCCGDIPGIIRALKRRPHAAIAHAA